MSVHVPKRVIDALQRGTIGMSQTLTVRVEPGVYLAVQGIANNFGWTTSDVVSTLLWMSILGLDPKLVPEEAWRSLTADALRILGNFAALGIMNPAKAKDNLLKTALLFSKSQGRGK